MQQQQGNKEGKKEEAKEFLDRWRLDGLIKRYSNYIIHPIRVRVIFDDGEVMEYVVRDQPSVR